LISSAVSTRIRMSSTDIS